jgi:hypothetical protein
VKKTHQIEIEPPFRSISTERLRKAQPMYRIREVDGHDDDVADTLADLHRLTFFDGASIPEFDQGHWWLAFFETVPVAFAGLVPSTRAGNAGYFSRVGVLQKHCGNRLQLRLMRAMETRAKHNGWNCVVSDTTDNLTSARRLSTVPAAISMGLAEYAILAKIHHLFRTAPKARLRFMGF